MNSTDRAIIDMRERADTLLTERARLGTAMRRIHALAGLSGVKACFEAELERLTAANDHDRNFIG
jgi:hypothetical protein